MAKRPNGSCVGGSCGGGTGDGTVGGKGVSGSGSCGTGGCGGSGSFDSKGNTDNNNSPNCDKSPLDFAEAILGRGGGPLNLVKRKLNDVVKEMKDYICDRKIINDVHYIRTEKECDGEVNFSRGDLHFRCIDGYLHYASRGNQTIQPARSSASRSSNFAPLRKEEIRGSFSNKTNNSGQVSSSSASNFSTSTSSLTVNTLDETPINDENCVVGFKPPVLCRGRFGSWETEETYPLTENCECEPIYGELAGERVRLHKVPSSNQVRHVISNSVGVPNKTAPSYDEQDDSYVVVIGLRAFNITPPERTPKPLSKENPYSIMYVERTEGDKTVIGTGVLIDTFGGRIGTEDHLFARHAVNSRINVDVSINDSGQWNRLGQNADGDPTYIFHSPDLHLNRPSLDASIFIHEGTVVGDGYKYGIYDEGVPAVGHFTEREQQKGERSASNLNRYAGTYDTYCVEAASYLPADSILRRNDGFDKPLVNLWRESSSAIQLNTPLPPLRDDSFDKNITNHERVLEDNQAHYGTLVRSLPRQYGSPVNQDYIPIGLEAPPLVDGEIVSDIEGVCGDSYVGGYSVRRTSYISDEVPENIAFEYPTPQVNAGILQWLLDRIIPNLGLKSYGELPRSGQGAEGINIRNDRSDTIFFPGVLKHNLFSWYSADVPLSQRQVAEREAGEVHVHNLKGLKRDSSYPFGTNWKDGYLNRFYIPWNKPPSWVMIAIMVIHFLFVYGVALWIWLEGGVMLSKISFGLTVAPFGAIGFVISVIAGVVWIGAWNSTDYDNKLLARFMNIDLAYPDFEFEGRYFMREGRAVQFEDNYHRINPDYLFVNEWEVGYGMSDPYNTCYCPDEFSNRMLFSNKQRIDSYIDAWQNFQGNNYFDVATEHGPITNIFVMGNQAFAHTTDMILALERGDQSLETLDGTQIAIGSGSLFRRALPLHGGVVEGQGGLLDPNAAIVTQWGYFFIDREARSLYNFTPSQGLRKVNDIGVDQFFNENLHFKLLEEFPNFECVDQKTDLGIGYSLGVDHEHNRLLVTKIDYSPIGGATVPDKGGSSSLQNPSLFCNQSFTLSYSPEEQKWISFHSYTPKLYTWNRFHLFSYTNEEGQWRHNRKGHYQTFYDEYYPFLVEAVVRNGSYPDDFDYQGMIVDNECYTRKGCEWIRNTKATFNHAIFFNSHQNSGELPLVNNNDDLSLTEMSVDDPGEVKLEFKNRRWNLADIYDHLINPSEQMWGCKCEVKPRPLNDGNIDYEITRNGELGERYTFNDNHLSVRFIFDDRNKVPNPEEIKFFLKNLQTQIDQEIETDAE